MPYRDHRFAAARQQLFDELHWCAVVARGASCNVEAEDGSGVTINMGGSVSDGRAVVTITASKAFEIRHRVTATGAGGSPANFGDEVYTQVWVRRA